MATNKSRVRHKHFRLDSRKLSRARKVLHANNDTETIERALDLVLLEYRRNQLASRATERFLESGAKIKDVYGKLEE